MREVKPQSKKIVELLLRDHIRVHTLSSIAATIKTNRMTAWRKIQYLLEHKYIIELSTSEGSTSTRYFRLNFDNPIVDKFLALSLTEHALLYERWRDSFNELENYVSFLILHGSILSSPKGANDIDIIGVVSKENNFKKIDKSILKIQNSETRTIHAINFTEQEFKDELTKPNKAFVDAVKKGVILYGQENFFQFMKEIHKVKI